LLELSDPLWAAFGDANRAWRELVPLLPLETFGFTAGSDNPLEDANSRLTKIGGGVEAWAFQANDLSIYKFYRPAEGTSKTIGSIFGFRSGDETEFVAEAKTGSYRQLFEKLLVIDELGGMPTEVIAATPEGIVVVKQALGDTLQQGDDVSRRLPPGLIEIPSRFLRANRDHPRLLFVGDKPVLVADLHSRNLVKADDGVLRAIDLVHVEWPPSVYRRSPLLAEWLERVQIDPNAGVLRSASDDEL
jgi:hypothetical protein